MKAVVGGVGFGVLLRNCKNNLLLIGCFSRVFVLCLWFGLYVVFRCLIRWNWGKFSVECILFLFNYRNG